MPLSNLPPGVTDRMIEEHANGYDDPNDLRNAYEHMRVGLRAIQARINGEWDNPCLVQFGGLMTDTNTDVLRIARETLAAYD